jgi:hypothetical protein
MSDRERNNAQMRERWVSHWSGYTNSLVRYVFYMFLRRRLKICHVYGAFYLDEVFGAFEGGEGSLGRARVFCCILVTLVHRGTSAIQNGIGVCLHLIDRPVVRWGYSTSTTNDDVPGQ